MEEELAQWDSTAFTPSSETIVEVVSVFLFRSDLLSTWRLFRCTPDLLSLFLISSHFISASYTFIPFIVKTS